MAVFFSGVCVFGGNSSESDETGAVTCLWRRLESVSTDFLVSTEPSLKHALLNQYQKRTMKTVACFLGLSCVLGSVQGMSPELSLC